MRSKRSASILPTLHPTIGTTFTTDCRSTKLLAHIRDPVTKPGSIVGEPRHERSVCDDFRDNCGNRSSHFDDRTNATARFIWNASNSVPIGLYRVQPVKRLSLTELVAVQPPDLLAAFLDLNGYLPIGVPMLKRVLALPGQTVCRSGLTIAVDGIDVGEAQKRDGRGRPLPVWNGCLVVADGDLFVMNWQSADSLDSRYFGPLPASAVIGRAVPVWTEGE
jgi:conjugative transfer signal peptidase TraF